MFTTLLVFPKLATCPLNHYKIKYLYCIKLETFQRIWSDLHYCLFLNCFLFLYVIVFVHVSVFYVCKYLLNKNVSSALTVYKALGQLFHPGCHWGNQACIDASAPPRHHSSVPSLLPMLDARHLLPLPSNLLLRCERP